MSLFEKLKDTKLKSLKFGEKGTKGDSTKPYIVTDINTVDTPLNKFRLTKFDDGLIRGGAIGSLNAGLIDTLRISKFLTDFPKGPLFITKQVGLQLANPSVETKKLDTNIAGTGFLGKIATGAINTVNKLNNLVGGPTRIYNLGINTLAQIPLNAIGGHINRHGFLPKLDDEQKYESVVKENNKDKGDNNRLVKLHNKFFADVDTRVNFFKNGKYATTNETEISNSFGGAKSVYGIGRTILRRTTITGDKDEIRASLNKTVSRLIDPDILNYTSKDASIYQKYKIKFDSSASEDTFKYTPVTASLNKPVNRLINPDILNYTSKDASIYQKYKIKFDPSASEDTFKYTPVTASIDTSRIKTSSGSIIVKSEPTSSFTNPTTYNKVYNVSSSEDPFKKENFTLPITKNNLLGAETVLFKNIDAFITRKSKEDINKSKNHLDYNYKIKTALANTYNRIDENILQVIFTQLDPFTGKNLNILPFSAYITGYSETYDSSWSSTKYNGRSEFFYNFDSYKKIASFKLQIPIFKPDELEIKHNRLKLLQQGLAGKYLNNRLGGIITKINLGHYLYGAFCIINSMNITIPDSATWDWNVNGDSNNAYSTLLEVNFNIIIINDKIPGFSETILTVIKDIPKVNPIPKTDPLYIAKPPLLTIRADANVNKFTPDNFGNAVFKGTNAKEASRNKTLQNTKLTPAQNKALADKLTMK